MIKLLLKLWIAAFFLALTVVICCVLGSALLFAPTGWKIAIAAISLFWIPTSFVIYVWLSSFIRRHVAMDVLLHMETEK